MKATVFPVDVRWDPEKSKHIKTPTIKRWQDSQMTLSDVKTPNYGVNIVQGRMIVDLDTYKNPLIKQQLKERFDLDLNHRTLIQTTVSGGEHHLVRVEPGVRYRQGSDLFGIIGFDTRCAGRGWICSGEQYKQQVGDIALAMCNDQVPYLPPELDALLREDNRPEPIEAPMETPTNRVDVEDVREALTFLDSDDYDFWIKIGMALQSVPSGFALWDEWSQKSDRYDPKQMSYKWSSLANTNVTPSSIFYFAMQRGWTNPNRRTLDGFDPSDFDAIEIDDDGKPTLEAFEYSTDGFVRLPNFCLEGLIQEGLVAIAGQSGLGKTLTMVPMAVAATGLFPNYHAQPLLPMVVHYFAEDVLQVERCLRAMSADGLIVLDDTFRERFIVHQAHRRGIEGWALIGKMDLGDRPLICMDTVSANCDLENENDATQVGRLIYALRQKVNCSIWMIGHVAKTQIDTENVTMRGSGAFGADAQQVITMTLNRQYDERLMQITKHRYEPEDYDTALVYEISTHTVQLDGVNQLGEMKQVTGRYNLIAADDENARLERRDYTDEDAEEQKEQRKQNKMEARVVEALDRHGPMKITALRANVKGNDSLIGQIAQKLVSEGILKLCEDGFFSKNELANF